MVAGMIEPLDPFALQFDSITPDPALASRTLADPTLRIPLDAPAPQGPGFYLLDDAGGRFVIDHEMGVVSLADEGILERERDAIHVARLKVVEPSGAIYEIDLRLKLTGHVPQIAEEPASEELAALPEMPAVTLPPAPAVAFTQFRAFEFGHVDALGAEDAAFGALIAQPPLRGPAPNARLALDAAPPTPGPRAAAWSL